jgi:hypothetical protein
MLWPVPLRNFSELATNVLPTSVLRCEMPICCLANDRWFHKRIPSLGQAAANDACQYAFQVPASRMNFALQSKNLIFISFAPRLQHLTA